MSFLGYATCTECKGLIYFNEVDEINLWYHPDDPEPLAEVKCACGETIEARIGMDHFFNLKSRGCVAKPFNDKFEKLTEEMINEWKIDEELAGLF